MKIKNLLFIFCFCLLPIFAFSQDTDPYCNEDACGALDPSWQLSGSQTVACEGETFFLRSGESVPYNNIDSYTWILTNVVTGEELVNVTYADTTPLEFKYDVNDSIACLNDRINIEVRLIVTSPACASGESCRYTAEPLTVVFKPRANFTTDPLVCVNNSVSFINLSCNAGSYAWDFDGDGNIDSTDPNPVYTYSSPGTYTVSLTTVNECGSDTKMRTIQVVGYPEAEIDLGVTGGDICRPDFQSVTLNANEWVGGASGRFNWEITPGYTNMDGDWCFVDPEYDGSGQICWDDEDFTVNTVDSLLSLEEQLDLYFSQSGQYLLTLNYGNVCETLSVVDTINVHAPPFIHGMEDQSGCDEVEVCFSNLGTSISGDYESVEWEFENGSSSGSPVLDFGCVTFQTSGTMTLHVKAFDPCLDQSVTINVAVVTTQEVSVPDPNPNVICQNSGLIPLDPSAPGGKYFYDDLEATFITNDTLNPSGLEPRNYTVTYVLSDNPACPAEDVFSFTVQEGPSVTLGDNAPVCESTSNFTPAILTSGGDIDSWKWTIKDSNGDTAATSSDQHPSFSISRPDTYAIIVEAISDECGSVMDTSELLIQAKEPVVIDPFDNPYCQGSTPDTLSASPSGGSWSGNGIRNVDALGIFNPAELIPGRYPITYSIVNGACSSSATEFIEVVASENVSVTDTFFCITDDPGQLKVSPTGGIFTGMGIVNANDGIFDPERAGRGSKMILYSYVDTNNCEVKKNINVDVDTIPTLSGKDTVFVCMVDEDIDISSLVNVDTRGETGTTTYTGTGIVNPSGTFNGSSLDMGFYTITVDFSARTCSAQDSFVIELAEKPELILSEDDTVCVTDGSLILTANIAGGVWSSPNCVIDPMTGEVDLTLSGETECVFRYTISAGTSCEQSDVVNIKIIDLADDLQLPPPTSICYFSGLYTIPNFSPAGGTWSGEGMVDASLGMINVSLLNQDTTYIYTYCIESQETVCEACKDFELTIEPLPEAKFSIAGSLCQDQSFSAINESLNAASAVWDFGDGPVNSPIHTYTTPGQKTITLIVETAFGCADTSIQQVEVTAPPRLDLVITTEEGCAPLDIEYTNNSRGDSISQYWIIDGVDTLFEARPEITLDSVTTDSLITLELVVYNKCDTLRQSKEILVHPYPFVDFGINDDEGCSPDTVYFANATLGLPDTLIWNFGRIDMDTSMQFDPPPQVFYSPRDSISTYLISLYASNECGNDLLEKEILVYPPNVYAFFEIDTLSGCPPLAVNIRNYATMGSTVTYDFGDGGTGNTGDTTYIYTEPGKYVITQYASLCGTDFIQSDTITVFPLANIDFDLPTYACMGDTVQFTNRSTNGIVSEWHFGDGTTSDQMNPFHVYDSSGTYMVSLIMNSTYNDCPDTLTQPIIIPELPQASFEAMPAQVCPNERVRFESQNLGALDFEWDFGDSSRSDQENPTHIYRESGIYEVSLTVTDEYQCSVDTTFINMLVHPVPESDFVLSTDEICQHYDTLIVTNTSTGYANSIWNLNGEFYADQQNNLRMVSENVGDQQLELISINSFGCRDTTNATFEVLPSPLAQSNFEYMEGCQELTLDFIDLSENANWRGWVLDGQNTSNDSIHRHTFMEPGNYPIQLIASNTNGCPSDTFFMEVELFPRAIANFEILPFDSCGTPLEIQMMNTSEFSSDYLWNFGNGDTSSFFDPIAQYDVPDLYQVSLMASNGFDCPDTITKDLAIYPQTIADFTIPDAELCEGDTVTIVNNSFGANAYDWFLNDAYFDDFPLVITQSGQYTLTLVARFDDKCFDTLMVQNVMTVYHAPYADFIAIINESPNIIGDVRFQNLSIDSEAFLWEFGDGKTSNEEHPEHEYDVDGPVTVTLYSYHNNNGLFQCIDESSELINYELINTFYVPNAVSPDQTYGNEEVGIFKPKGVGIETYELNIYSPWGDKVATLNQVLNGEPIDFWDGTFNGEPVPQGAYLWKASIKYKSGHSDFKQGNVTVIR